MSHELAERAQGAVLVRLLWNDVEDAVRIEYFDLDRGETFSSPVPKAEALNAFNHPNAYRLAA